MSKTLCVGSFAETLYFGDVVLPIVTIEVAAQVPVIDNSNIFVRNYNSEYSNDKICTSESHTH
jgi:hypothetical protein